MNIVSVGALNYAQVHPREVMKSAILSNAASIMVVHNHPSGNLTPSKEDILLTDRLQQVGDLLRIPLMDHIITGKNYEYYSIREQMDYRASPAELTDDANSLKWTQTMVAEEQFYQDSSNAEETKQKKLDEIMEGLERGVNDILSSENYKKYLKFLSSFHQYSLNNTILIYAQKPDASLVAGYRKWQTMGRQVKKGEKGIKILAPIPVRVKSERVKRDPITKEIIKGEDGEPMKEEVEATIPKFKISTVFDIEQTEGEPMVIDGMSGDHVTLLSNINGEDRVNSELIEMDSLGRKLESTLESIQKEVDRHNAIVEKDVKLSFYAAECEDFPILGEYHENIETFEEAIKIYENLKKDRFLGDEGIGFKLTVNGKYKGRFTLIQGANRLIGLEKEGSFMDHPMINQAVDKAKRYVKSFEKSEMIQATVKRNTTKIEL